MRYKQKIPCDKCGRQIPVPEYEDHQLAHRNSQQDSHSNPMNEQNLPPISSTITNTQHDDDSKYEVQKIPCDKCGQLIPSNVYQDHQLLHVLSPNQKAQVCDIFK